MNLVTMGCQTIVHKESKQTFRLLALNKHRYQSYVDEIIHEYDTL